MTRPPWSGGPRMGRRLLRGRADGTRKECHVDSRGKFSGQCRAMRRDERSTHTASLTSRSRSVATWLWAQTVVAARRRNSWKSRYAARVSRTRNWLAWSFGQRPVHLQPVMLFREPILHVALACHLKIPILVKVFPQYV
jgi:hypothetical protein